MYSSWIEIISINIHWLCEVEPAAARNLAKFKFNSVIAGGCIIKIYILVSTQVCAGVGKIKISSGPQSVTVLVGLHHNIKNPCLLFGSPPHPASQQTPIWWWPCRAAAQSPKTEHTIDFSVHIRGNRRNRRCYTFHRLCLSAARTPRNGSI